jgi:hypothetical protein
MSELVLDRKKLIEKLYVEEAMRASSIFPSGTFVPHENPDFLLHNGSDIYGIEVTELCRERPRTEAATQSKVTKRAKALYDAMTDTEPLDVSLAFSRAATDVDPNQLIRSLVDFVYAHRDSRGVCAANDLPRGYCHIGIHEPHLEIDSAGRWHGSRAFGVEIASQQLIAACVAKKGKRFGTYREAATTVWLLVVNDQFLGPGEVYVRPEDLSEWEFSFEFEKVLLFAREPGGGGRVFELRRQSLAE